MTDKEITREKTFSEELLYFKERIEEVFDNYNNPNGNEDPLYICVLRDSKRIVRKAEEEITRQQTEIERLKECPKCVYEYDGEVMEHCVQGSCSNFKSVEQIKAEAYKEFAERIRECCNSNNELSADAWLSVTTDINCVLKEMVGEQE